MAVKVMHDSIRRRYAIMWNGDFINTKRRRVNEPLDFDALIAAMKNGHRSSRKKSASISRCRICIRFRSNIYIIAVCLLSFSRTEKQQRIDPLRAGAKTRTHKRKRQSASPKRRSVRSVWVIFAKACEFESPHIRWKSLCGRRSFRRSLFSVL